MNSFLVIFSYPETISTYKMLENLQNEFTNNCKRLFTIRGYNTNDNNKQISYIYICLLINDESQTEKELYNKITAINNIKNYTRQNINDYHLLMIFKRNDSTQIIDHNHGVINFFDKIINPLIEEEIENKKNTTFHY